MPQKIVFLPDAGPENPFQYELTRYLREHGHIVNIGRKYPLGSTFKALNEYQPDVIYYDWVHSFILGKSWGWSMIKSLTFVLEIAYAYYVKRIRIVHTLHNLQNHAGLWLGLERIFYGFFLRHCHQIRVYSDTTRQVAIEKFGLNPAHIQVIQDLPYHFYYQNTASRVESRQKLNLKETDFVYLFFGEIKPYKGLDNLLAAYAQVATPSDRLLIAGKSYDASYFASLKNLGDKIPSVRWFHRFIEDQEVQFFFNAADVVVLPFVRIDHSGSVDLAMSFAKPVVTLHTESMAQLLHNQRELLFETSKKLGECLQKAKKINVEVVGQQNFATADATNYKDILRLFEP